MTSISTQQAAPPDDEDALERAARIGRRRVPGLIAALAVLAGLVDVLSAITPAFASRLIELSPVVPGMVSSAATAGTLVAGISLLLLGRALHRRKRRAWRGAVALVALSVVLHLVKGLDVEESAVSIGVLAALLLTRSEFQAKGDPRTRWRAVWAGLGLAGASLVLGSLVLVTYHRFLVGSHTLGDEVRHLLLGLVGVHGPLDYDLDRRDDVVSFLLAGLGLLTLVTPVYLALRPAEPRATLSADDEARMRALLAAHGGRDSLGYFALRRDKAVVWSPSGKACVAYRVVSGVMLASGDPIGDPEAWPGAIREWLALAAEHAWEPAVIGCSETAATAYHRVGLEALELGDEAVVEVDDFSLEGRPMRGVRQAVARVERAGYQTSVRRARDVPAAELAALRDSAAAWRGAETERGFSMALGRFGRPEDGDCVVVTAVREGALAGLLHFVPWGRDGLSLDLMRRDREADNGLNELMIVDLLRACPGLGVGRVSLNFAAFRSALERGERIGAGPVLKLWRNLLVFLSRWFQIDSLYRFNAKFRPLWEPRFICYPAARDLPRVALAALEAEAFIVWPRPRVRTLRRSLHLEVPR